MYKLCRNLVFCLAHFQIFWHWLILCKWMFTPDLSDWMAYCTPLIPWFWTFSWLCASNVCTPFRRSFAFYAKSIYFINPALQRIMPICGFHWHFSYSIWISTFILLHTVYFKAIVCGSQGVPVATTYCV